MLNGGPAGPPKGLRLDVVTAAAWSVIQFKQEAAYWAPTPHLHTLAHCNNQGALEGDEFKSKMQSI
jgi:hypothetical protein